VARPIPREAPVIRAVLLPRFGMIRGVLGVSSGEARSIIQSRGNAPFRAKAHIKFGRTEIGESGCGGQCHGGLAGDGAAEGPSKATAARAAGARLFAPKS
jgi:hypothetical protein